MRNDETRTRTKNKELVDEVRQSPVDLSLRRTRRRLTWLLLIIVVLCIAGSLVWRFTADRPVDSSAIPEHFKYGSAANREAPSPMPSAGYCRLTPSSRCCRRFVRTSSRVGTRRWDSFSRKGTSCPSEYPSDFGWVSIRWDLTARFAIRAPYAKRRRASARSSSVCPPTSSIYRIYSASC